MSCECANEKVKNKTGRNVQWTKNWNDHFKDYCNSTGIHGVKYFGESRSIFERICWIIVVLTLFSGCAYLIFKTYKKWELSPVIVSFRTSETQIYQLPFPAVTICPEIKFKKAKYNFTKFTHMKQDNVTFTHSQNKTFGFMIMICEDEIFETEEEVFVNHDNDTEFLDFIRDATPDFINNTLFCKWLGEYMSCDTFFVPIILDEGVCYTFNMLDRTELFTENVVHVDDYHNINKGLVDWNPETFKYGTKKVLAYPRRALVPGAADAFKVVLATSKTDIDYLCKDSLQGHRVLLHHPAKIPRLSKNYFRIPLDQSVSAAIKPSIMETSETLKHYAPESRGCYFPVERKLKYFKVYTQENCQLECFTNFTLSICNCSHFYMPRFKGEKICGGGTVQCIEDSEAMYVTGGLKIKFKEKHMDDFFKHVDINTMYDCNCLPDCVSVDYNVEISQNAWNWKEHFKSLRFNISSELKEFTENNTHMSCFEIFFVSSQTIGLQRNELYGPTDFLANFGGLLGLFTGFTLISLFEIFYFLTLRLFCNYRLYKNKYWPKWEH